MNRTSWLVVGGIGAVALFGLAMYLTSATSSSSATSPTSQAAANPNAQVGAGAFAQGTMPDIGNLLSYNQVPGSLSAPQATSVVTGVYG